MADITQLVAHRGDPTERPENTLPAIAAAVQAGARFVEFDVQMSSDGIPVLLHDDSVERTTGRKALVMDLPAAELAQLTADFAGPACAEARIPLLSELRGLLDGTPHVTAFVELKAESLHRFGTERMVDKTVEILDGARFPWVIISFEKEALDHASSRHYVPIGWVLHKHDAGSLQQARILSPSYLFCDVEKLPPGRLESGPWTWVVYDVSAWDEIETLNARGAHLVETSRFSALAALKRKAS